MFHRLRRLRAPGVVAALVIALGLALGAGHVSQAEPQPAAAVALADEPSATVGGGVDGHDLGSACLAISCLLLVLALCLWPGRRRGGLIGRASRRVQALVPTSAGLWDVSRRPVPPTRC